MRLTLLAACLIGFVAFVSPKSIDRTRQVRLNPPHISIINGIPAQPGDFPFMASLLLPRTETTNEMCGGTLIASSYILTAAHCVHNLPTNFGNGKVYINTLNNTGGTGSTNRTVSKYIAHQQFFANATHVMNDIALLVLDRPVPAADKIPFVQLPIDDASTTKTTPKPTTTTPKPTTTTPKPTTTTPPRPTEKTTTNTKTTTTLKPSTTTVKVITTSKPVVKSTIKKLAAHPRAFSTYSNQSAIIAGWGATSSASTSRTLQKANVTVYDNTVCKQQWDVAFDGSKQVCAAQVKTATCSGDSGGPLLVNGNVQIGVTSFSSTDGCDDPTSVPVYTRVSAYLDWIAATMASNPPPPAVGK